MIDPKKSQRAATGLSRIGILIIIVAAAIVLCVSGYALFGGSPRSDDSGSLPVESDDSSQSAASQSRPFSIKANTTYNSRRVEATAEIDPFDQSTLDPGAFELTGRVVDPDKKPVANAVVRMFVASAILQSTTYIDSYRNNGLLVYEKLKRSGSDGTFKFRGPFTDGCDFAITVTATDLAPGIFHQQHLEGGKITNIGDLQLARGFEIAGTVFDHAGNPLPSASVGYILSPSEASIERFLEQNEPEDYKPSDEKGQYRIQHLTEGRYTLIAYAPGYARAASPPVVLSKDKPPRPVDITLALGDQIAGNILNSEGGPIAGAKIKVRLQSSDPQETGGAQAHSDDSQFFDFPITTGSDTEGNFQIQGLLANANYRLSVSAKDHRAMSMKASSGTTDLIIQLKPDFQVTGIVIDKETGQPVPGARVAVFRGKLNDLKKGFFAMPKANAQTDSAGQFLARDDGAPGPAAVLAWAPTYAPELSATIQLTEGGEIPETKIELTHGAAIAGRVRIGASRQPIAGASLNLYFSGDPTNVASVSYKIGAFAARATSDSEGNYAFDGLLGGNYIVEVRTESNGTGRSDIIMLGAADRKMGADIDLPTPSTIKGVILNNTGENPVRVIATRSDGLMSAVFADAESKFIIKNLGAGQFKVRAEKVSFSDDASGGTFGRKSNAVDVILKEGDTIELVLEVPDSNFGKLVGTINDAGGPGSGYTLILTNAPPSGGGKSKQNIQFSNYKTVTADVDGYFEFQNVREGSYRIYAIPRGRGVAPKNTVASEPVQIFANSTARSTLFGQSGPLKGTVSKYDGTGAANAKIIATVNAERSPTSALPGGTTFMANTNKLGSFDFGRLPGGAYDIIIEAPGSPKKLVTAAIYGGSEDPIYVTLDAPPNNPNKPKQQQKPNNPNPQQKTGPKPNPQPPPQPPGNTPHRRRRQ